MPKNCHIPDPLFPAGPPVAGKTMVGREDVVRDVLRLLEMGQSCILTAPRRYGKTSVMLEVLARLRRKGHFTALMDLFTVNSKRMFADKFVSSCLANNPGWLEKSWDKMKKGGLALLEGLRFKPSIADAEVVVQLEMPHADPYELMEKAFDFPERFAKKHGKLLFFAFDEFQTILEFAGSDTVKALRAHIQHHRHVRYLFAGSQESMMNQLFKDRQHAFYRFGRIIGIGSVLKDAFVPYIVKSFSGQGIGIDKTIASALCDRTGGQPYYTQLLCQMIYEIVSRTKRRAVTSDDLGPALDNLIAHEEGLFSDWWSNLGQKKHAHIILSYIATGCSPYEITDVSRANINRVVTDLKKWGYIGRHERAGRKAHFFIRDNFFSQYIRRMS